MVKDKFSFILMILILSTPAFAFDERRTWLRYMNMPDLINSLKKINPNFNHECIRLDTDNAKVLGFHDPASGKPLSEKPNFAFLNLYSSCLREAITLSSGNGYYDQNLPYNELTITPENVKKMITYSTRKLIGPEAVLTSYGHVKSEAEFVEIIYNSLPEIENRSMWSYAIEAVYLIGMRDEFLSY